MHFVVTFKTVYKLIEALDIVDDDKIKNTDIELDLLALKNMPDSKNSENKNSSISFEK